MSWTNDLPEPKSLLPEKAEEVIKKESAKALEKLNQTPVLNSSKLTEAKNMLESKLKKLFERIMSVELVLVTCIGSDEITPEPQISIAFKLDYKSLKQVRAIITITKSI